MEPLLPQIPYFSLVPRNITMLFVDEPSVPLFFLLNLLKHGFSESDWTGRLDRENRNENWFFKLKESDFLLIT